MEHDAIRSSRIVLFDENIASLSLLQSVLNRVGYRSITGYTDFGEVIRIVAERSADLIVANLSLDEESFTFIKHTRGNVPRGQWIPVFVVTDSKDEDSRRRAFTARVTELLARPFDWAEFILRIRNVLMLQSLNDHLREQNRVLEYQVAARTRSLAERTEELETALAELKGTQKQVLQQERFRAFGEMAGGIAHDFNNVLMCVVGYTELMLGDQKILSATPSVEKFLRTMNRAGHDASKIVARLRNFYRPREDADVFTLTDLNKLMEEVVPLTQPKWKNQALTEGRVIEVVLDLRETKPIPCNAPEIRESIVNLVFNAVDAMPEGGTITLRTRTGAKAVTLGVSDTGSGMSEEVRQKCMEPFFSTKGDKGTGLGLAMVFGIAKRHDGLVEIESELGRGTTFWIQLSAELAAQSEEAVSKTVLDRPLHVLTVDDEDLPRDIVARYLVADGHHVESAIDAYDASEKFGGRTFDLVITDHAMPGINGCQLAVNLKKRGNPAILLLTGSSESILAEGIPPGIDEVVGKPITQEALRAAMARALRRNQKSSASLESTASSLLNETP
jgi:signal transduction histidine kinase/ActR/RegA family two-component response regulator